MELQKAARVTTPRGFAFPARDRIVKVVANSNEGRKYTFEMCTKVFFLVLRLRFGDTSC